jgi:hypothetical protein
VINTITVDKRWVPSETNYGYTMSTWIRVDPSSCVQPNPTIAVTSCNIVLVQGVFMIYMVDSNHAKFNFFAL